MGRIRAAWRAVWRRGRLHAAMDEEMRFHIQMEADRLVREGGLPPAEARRRAHIAFGGLEKYKGAGRDAMGFNWLDSVSLDARLAARMLVKHRGLTLVGGFAMAVAIAIGAASFEIFSQLLNPALPHEEGHRIVAVQYATPTSGSAERRVLHDFFDWRQQVRTIEHLSAFRTARHTLQYGGSLREPVRVAEMTAAGFAVARTPPLAGRYLVPDDEREEAPGVVVVGHRAWQTHFAGDHAILGRTILLGGTPLTVVGIMPDGFRFPLDHQFWVPLRLQPRDYERFQGPRLFLFGRLAPGVSLEEANAELTVLRERAAAEDPARYEGLRAAVFPYTYDHLEITDRYRVWALRIARIFLALLTFVVAINLAILFYARTVTRLGEIAVRTALGATRRRILSQLFVEAFALTLAGAAGGLLLARMGLERFQALLQSQALGIYWIDLHISPATGAYAVGLAVVAALLVGVLPGLRATASSVNTNLRELDSRTGARLGPVWTMLVVAQVAAAVAALPAAVYIGWEVSRMGTGSPTIDADRIGIAVVAVGDELPAEPADVRSRHLELASRLEAEPGVASVTFSSGVPGFSPGRLLRFEDVATARFAGHNLGVDVLEVGVDIFDTYGVEMRAGRTLVPSDAGAARAVVVNQAFVDELLVAGAGVGVRFRYVSPYERPGTTPDTSYEIVGVVRDFPDLPRGPGSDRSPVVYHAGSPGDVHPLVLSARFHGPVPSNFAERFRSAAAAVDPSLQVLRAVPLATYYDELRAFWQQIAIAVGLVTISVVLLSAAGIYALMSFTVAQRTREIAIRTALGAAPHRLILGIFSRASRQLGIGLLVGSLLSVVACDAMAFSSAQAALLTLAVASTMALVGLIATIGPARRGLRIQASEALKSNG